MELTDIERIILANQFEILAILKPDEKEEYLEKKEIVNKGYFLDFEQLYAFITENKITYAECAEVRSILCMFDNIQSSYENLTNKSSINENDIFFKGFDMQSEAEQCGYAEFFLSKRSTYNKFLPKRTKDMNSHAPMLRQYREMLSAWESIPAENHKHLSEEQIKSLVS